MTQLPLWILIFVALGIPVLVATRWLVITIERRLLGFNRLAPTQDEPKHKDVEYYVVPFVLGVCEADRQTV
jgi:hypothetical protein